MDDPSFTMSMPRTTCEIVQGEEQFLIPLMMAKSCSYGHRLCQDGTPLEYYAIAGKKQEDIPNSMISN
jgi:hypothetical protein